MCYRSGKPALVLLLGALLCLAATGCGSSSAQAPAEGKACSSQDCFATHFANCEAAHYETPAHGGARARYQILGARDTACRVQMVFVETPNAAWANKPLNVSLDPEQSFEPQIKKAVQECVMNDGPGSHACSGPLRGVAAGGGASTAAGQPSGPGVLGRAASVGAPGDSTDLPPIPDDAPTRFPVQQDGKWGYINRDGRLVIEPRFKWRKAFYEGRAGVSVGDGWGYIDRAGKMVIEAQFARAGRFSDGLAAVKAQGKDLWGFIDRKGEMVIPVQFHHAGYFSEGLAPASEGDPGGDHQWNWGFIDRNGAWVIEPRFGRALAFSQGLAPVELANSGAWAYVDTTGAIVLDGKSAGMGRWTRALPFSHGLAAVETKDGNYPHWQYVDKEGHVAVAPTFGSGGSKPDRAYSFSEGLGLVYYDGVDQWEYILPTKEGTEATFTDLDGSRWYEKAEPYRGGLARVRPRYLPGHRDESTWRYVDRQGTPVWPPDEEAADENAP